MWATVNIFVYMHILLLGQVVTSEYATLDFKFRDLDMTPSRSSKVTLFCGFRKSNIDIPKVFHTNHGSISHRLATVHECNRRPTDDRQHSADTDSWLASHESARTTVALHGSCLFGPDWAVLNGTVDLLYGPQLQTSIRCKHYGISLDELVASLFECADRMDIVCNHI